MKIISAKHLGFCSGVKRAIEIAKRALKKDKKPIWFLGELVHNELVIKKFKKKNVKFISSPRTAKSGTMIIQAHGFPPLPRATSNKLLIRDATCPLVKKVQMLASFLYRRGYKVVIIGDKNHSEVKGINGYIANKGIIVENEKQAKKLPRFNKIGVVAQTTQGKEKFKQILKILKRKSKKLKYFNTLCPEVRARQKELSKILQKCREIIVVGSKSSANTKRLAEKATSLKKKVSWINSLKELKKKKLKKIPLLGLVSGTSAPNWEIDKIKKYLNKFK